MSLAIVYSRARLGMDAPLVTVEVHLSNGLPSLSIVGLPETAVKESKDRVRSAILNSHFDFPKRRITVNLAPADLPKEGGRFDLPIALGILAANRQIPHGELDANEFTGELALSGELRPVTGALPVALHATSAGRSLVLAADNAAEAVLVNSASIIAGRHLLDITAHLSGTQRIEPACHDHAAAQAHCHPDMADVRGQQYARRALEIAASGGHSLLLIGPPGTGKSMLASRLPGILPPLTEQEAVEVAALRSINGEKHDAGIWRLRPFRAPHHSASSVAMVGGGSNPRPGEISLAHNGVLFLDELPEFDRRVLEVLREPLETGHINIARAMRQVTYPARSQLIAAMNPCNCGWLGDPSGRCRCTSEQVLKYRNRISGPLLDRIDMHVEVPRLVFEEMNSATGEHSDAVRRRVIPSRELQCRRGDRVNAQLANNEIDEYCALGTHAQGVLKRAMQQLQLSARAHHRILKLARTIADMDHSTPIETVHLSEAINLRQLDRSCNAGT